MVYWNQFKWPEAKNPSILTYGLFSKHVCRSDLQSRKKFPDKKRNSRPSRANSLWLYVTSLLMLRSVTQIQRKKMSLRHIQDFVLRPWRLMTKPDVVTMSGRRRQTYYVWKRSIKQRLCGNVFVTSIWR